MLGRTSNVTNFLMFTQTGVPCATVRNDHGTPAVYLKLLCVRRERSLRLAPLDTKLLSYNTCMRSILACATKNKKLEG